MRERFLLSVDPQRIRFNPRNPRKHQGFELDRLRESIQRYGILQPPIVRSLPGDLFETVDGEGRTFIALEMGFKELQVLDIGSVSADDALVLLQVSNSIRNFNFLAECRGFAHLHRQQMNMKNLAKEFGYSHGKMQDMVNIGYLPDDIHTTIQQHITVAEEPARIWTPTLFTTMLALREVLPGQTHKYGGTWISLDEIYDYTEVRSALQEILEGHIKTAEEMKTYVAQRRYEIYQARFDTLLAQKLDEELAAAKQELALAQQKEWEAQQKLLEEQKREITKQGEKKEEEAQAAKNELRTYYEGQIGVLETQLITLKKTYEVTKKEVAKQPERIKAQEEHLQQEIERTKIARRDLNLARQKLEEDAERREREQREQAARREREQRKERERWEAEKEQRLITDLDAQRARQEEAFQQRLKQRDQELKALEQELKMLYERKTQENQIKAENTIRGLLSHGVQHLAETQQIIDHIVSSSMLQPVRTLGGAHQESLLWAVRSLSEALDRAEKKLVDDGILPVVDGNLSTF